MLWVTRTLISVPKLWHLLPEYWFKEIVSRDLRLVLLYINQKLFSGVIVAHHKILILLKWHFTINKRRSSVMNGPTILDVLHNSRCGNHDRWAYFLSENISIKHYGIVRTAESRVTLLRFPNFLRQPHIHKLRYVIRGASSSRVMVKVIPYF